MNLRKLNDDELWRSTAELAATERKITLGVLLHLQEIDRRGLHLDRGYSSLYEYALKELKFSEGAAYRRVQAMRLLRDIPESESKIVDGSLNLTNAAKIQAAYRDKPKEEKAEAVTSLLGKTGKEVEQVLATGAPAREGTRWLTAEAVELRLHLKKESFHHLEELKALKASKPAQNTYGKVVEDLIDLGQQKWNPSRRTASTQRRNGASPKTETSEKAKPDPKPASSYSKSNPDPRYISAALRAEIWKRDGNQCTFVHQASGRRCEAKHFLQVDHIIPVALGGKSEESNLRLLCAQHNSRRAAKTFGPRP